MKTRPVEFYSFGEKLVGTMYLPDDYKEGAKLPCIIPCSGLTGINAAYPALLARLLTRHGYVCLGFDYRGWAPSEGEVGRTTAEGEYDDILAAYIFAQQQPEVQPENVGLFGWGFAAATALKVAANWPEIKAVGCGNGIYNGERCLRTLLTYYDYEAFLKIAREDMVRRVLTGKGAMVSPYQLHGSAQSQLYRNLRCEPLTLEAMENNDIIPKENQHDFRQVDGVPEAVERDYGGFQNFPPKQGFENFDSFMRIDASADVKKISPRPIFIVHALEDDTYPVIEAQSVAAEIGTTCTVCYVHGDHNSFMFDDHPEFASKRQI